jgi:uncharacterized protein
MVSNPAFSRDAVTPRDALKLLAANVRHKAHQFWGDEIDLVSAAWPYADRLHGRQQVTDAYLLGLARHKKGKLGTMDRAVLELLPDKSFERNLVTVI